MAVETPVGRFGSAAPPFRLPGVDGGLWTLDRIRGPRATVVMFLCNHCPYVKGIIERLVADLRALKSDGVGAVAIMPNDTEAYPDDNFAAMQRFAIQHDFPFPYLLDASQDTARAYGAVCTPDFFGFDAGLKLKYRGRLDGGRQNPIFDGPRELHDAMRAIATTGQAPCEQHPSLGCSIKWRAPP